MILQFVVLVSFLILADGDANVSLMIFAYISFALFLPTVIFSITTTFGKGFTPFLIFSVLEAGITNIFQLNINATGATGIFVIIIIGIILVVLSKILTKDEILTKNKKTFKKIIKIKYHIKYVVFYFYYLLKISENKFIFRNSIVVWLFTIAR